PEWFCLDDLPRQLLQVAALVGDARGEPIMRECPEACRGLQFRQQPPAGDGVVRAAERVLQLRKHARVTLRLAPVERGGEALDHVAQALRVDAGAMARLHRGPG